MERATKIGRIRKALMRKSQNRSVLDIDHIKEETAEVPMFVSNGDAVHQDLCYVAKLKRIGQGETAAIKGSQFVYVMSGAVRVVTDSVKPLENTRRDRLRATSQAANRASQSGNSGGVTEEEMQELFNSIDADGSGAIDGEELQTALEMMGIHLSDENIQELMDGVDDDGSGELEFPEFVEILTSKLKLGRPPERKWEEKDGQWERDFLESHSFGELSVLDNTEYKATLLATEAADLVVLEQSDYHMVLTEGFDGELKKKVNFISNTAVVQAALTATDLRSLAFACQRVRFPPKTWLYQEEQEANAVFLIESGECQVQRTVVEEIPDMSSGKRSVTAVLREDVMAERRRRVRMYPVATLGPGDMCGEDTVVHPGQPHSLSVAATSTVEAFKIDTRVLTRVLHPRDLERLREHSRAILNWRKSQLDIVVGAMQAAKDRASDMITRARRYQRQINEAREEAGLPRAHLSEISGLAGLADSDSVSTSARVDIGHLMDRIPPPDLEHQAVRHAQAAPPKPAAGAATSARARAARRRAKARAQGPSSMAVPDYSSGDSDVSLSEYATRNFKTDAVTRHAANRAPILQTTTRDRVRSQLDQPAAGAPSRPPSARAAPGAAGDATDWDGYEVESTSEMGFLPPADNSELLPLLSFRSPDHVDPRAPRHPVPQPRERSRARGKKAGPGGAPARVLRTGSLLASGPLSISVGLRSGSARVDLTKGDLTVKDLRHLMADVRGRVRRAQAERIHDGQRLSVKEVRHALQASRQAGEIPMASVPVPAGEGSPPPSPGRAEAESGGRALVTEDAGGTGVPADRSDREAAAGIAAADAAAEGAAGALAAKGGLSLQHGAMLRLAAQDGLTPEGSEQSARGLRADGSKSLRSRRPARQQPYEPPSWLPSDARAKERPAGSGGAATVPGPPRTPEEAPDPGRGPAPPAAADSWRAVGPEEARRRVAALVREHDGPAQTRGGGCAPKTRLDTVGALHKAGIGGTFGRKAAKFVGKTGGRLQAVASSKTRWWERDSVASQATRTVQYLQQRQEEELRARMAGAEGRPEGPGAPLGDALAMAGLLDALPSLAPPAHRQTGGLQAVARSATAVGGSQFGALKAAHAVLRTPLDIPEHTMGNYTPEQLGVTGFTRALNLAGIHVGPAKQGGRRAAGAGRQPRPTIAAVVGAQAGPAPGEMDVATRAGLPVAQVADRHRASVDDMDEDTRMLLNARGLLPVPGHDRLKRTLSGRVVMQLPTQEEGEEPGYVEVCMPKTLNDNSMVRQVAAFVPKGRLIKARRDRGPGGGGWH